MKGILEYVYDMEKDRVYCRRICKYDFTAGMWRWNKGGGKVKIEKYPEQVDVFCRISRRLEALWRENPMEEQVIFPAYYKGNRNG